MVWAATIDLSYRLFIFLSPSVPIGPPFPPDRLSERWKRDESRAMVQQDMEGRGPSLSSSCYDNNSHEAEGGMGGGESKEAGDTRDIIWSATCRSIWLNVFGLRRASRSEERRRAAAAAELLAIGGFSLLSNGVADDFIPLPFHLSISFGFSVLYSSLLPFLFFCLVFVVDPALLSNLFVVESIAPLFPVLANYISAQLSVGLL